VVASAPKRKALHFVGDNLSAHKTKAVKAWLAAHPRVTMHYTPTYSRWLNQLESWFAPDRTGLHCPRHLAVDDRPAPQVAPVHQAA
jgi:phospholipase/lecithinase/hemolysin